MSTLAIGAIGLYRRHLSPRKGFRCAHNVLHHHGSCSDFGLRVFGRLPFAGATHLMLRRLADCRRAYATLAAMSMPSPRDDGSPDGRKKRSGPCDALDAINCVTMPFPNAACADIGACDCFGGLF